MKNYGITIADDELHFFAARISKIVLQKFAYAVRLYGKTKQRCTEEALEMFSDEVIAQYHWTEKKIELRLDLLNKKL